MKIFYLVLIFSICVISSCSTSKKVKCPDGRTVFRQEKNPFELYNEEITKNINFSIQLLGNLKESSIGIETKKKIEAQIEKLNQESSRYWITIIALYQRLENDPCNIMISKEYNEAITEMFKISNLKDKTAENILKLSKQSGIGGANLEILMLELGKLSKIYK